MKQVLIAPQFGFAARQFADDVRNTPPIEPAAPSTLAHSGSSVFRPTTEPTIIVKAARRKSLAFEAATNNAAMVNRSGSSSPPVSGAGAARASKVFLLAPPLPAPARVAAGLSEPTGPEKEVGGESVDGALAPAAPLSRPRRRRRARDPLAAPVLIRHVVFERNDAPGEGQSEFRLDAAPGCEVDYLTVTGALAQLRDQVAALVKVHEGLVELDELTRLRAVASAPGIR